MQLVAGTPADLSRRRRPHLRRVIWAAREVFSFETAFLLFVFAPVYSADPRFAWFPGNTTLAFFGLSVAAGLVALLRGSLFYIPGIKAVCAGGILVLWIAASQLWSPSHIYASEKLIAVVAGNLWCLTATAMIIGSSRVRVWRFLILLLIFGVALAVDFTINSDIAVSARLAVEEPGDERSLTNYLLVGRLCGLAAVVAFVLWLETPRRTMRGPLLLVAFAVCGYTLLKGGGRNPTAAVAVGMLVPLLLSLRLPRGRLVISRRILASLGLIMVLALSVTYLAVSGSSLRTLQRFDVLIGRAQSGAEADSRFEFWRHAVDYWVERPVVGHGVGAWSILYWGKDIRHYPHNLILELLVEFGLIGLVLFAGLVLMLASKVSLRRLREDPALMCTVMLCINAFVNAMSTGDLSDNRNLFAVLGLLTMRPLRGPIDTGTERCRLQRSAPSPRRAILGERSEAAHRRKRVTLV